MDNIDVLLRAAEYIESKKLLLGPNNSKSLNYTHNDSLSTKSSISNTSSSSSSLLNLPNISINQALKKNDQICHDKSKLKSFIDTKQDIYSSSLPLNFVSSPNFIEIQKNDETKLTINKSMSRLDEMKRDKATHNTLEKNRRAHLKECFENLQNELPQYKDKKCTNLAILNYTLKFIEQSKKKDKENEFEKNRLLEEQIKLKTNLSKLALDFKTKYLELNSNTIDQAKIKFNSILHGLNINSNLFVACEKNDCKQFKTNDSEFENEKMNSFSKSTTSPKQIVARYYRKRSSNSLSIITGIKAIQPSQSLQLQLQNQVKMQKSGKRLNDQNRHRHYSVDDNIMKRQQNRKNNLSSTINDLVLDDENHNIDDDDDNEDDDIDDDVDDDDDIQSVDEKETKLEFDSIFFTNKAITDHEESNSFLINKCEKVIGKIKKRENIDIGTSNDTSKRPISSINSTNFFYPKSNLSDIAPKSNTMKRETIINFSNQNNSYYFNEKTSKMGYINASLIPNVQNLNLKTSIQENSSNKLNQNESQNILNPKQDNKILHF